MGIPDVNVMNLWADPVYVRLASSFNPLDNRPLWVHITWILAPTPGIGVQWRF